MDEYSTDDLEFFFSDKNDNQSLDVVVESVGILFCEKALPYLIGLLFNENRPWEIRLHAAEAIRNIGCESVIDVLLEAKKSANPKICELASIASSWRK